MTRYLKAVVFTVLCLLTMLSPTIVKSERKAQDGVVIYYDKQDDGTIILTEVKNENLKGVNIYIDNTSLDFEVRAGDSKPCRAHAKKFVKYSIKTGDNGLREMWRKSAQVVADNTVVKPEEPGPKATENNSENRRADSDSKTVREDRQVSETGSAKSMPVGNSGDSNDIPAIERLNRDPFFGQQAVNEFVSKTETLARGLEAATDKSQYMADHGITAFMTETQTELNRKRGEISYIAKQIMGTASASDPAMLSLVEETLDNRLSQREQAFQRLKELVDVSGKEDPVGDFLGDKIVNYSIIGVVALIAIIWIAVLVTRKRKKRAGNKNVTSRTGYAGEDSRPETNPAIVVRRRTTSILKKQSLEDVVGNPSYLEIDSSEFAADSAVRKIYVKNTCIKEVYNLYADDLRNSGNPKEDGCMVLGRWVFDDVARTYDISLETVVMPGDDAVFKEYELNFGGKIKLRIAERLRKLRRETNLQYDLVCWIHSHPGLGVFFSNSDENVQMQLKHPQHPNFLIAFVVDILTSDQETGIFTFRKDGTMNSKSDMVRMYSLEEMYKWALESDKLSFNKDNHYNVLAKASVTGPVCRGIFLDNSSIIDLLRLTETPESGLAGWAIGTSVEMTGGVGFLVSSVVSRDERQSVGVVGALLKVSHFSLPTIQRLINGVDPSLRFVLVYSSKQLTLTSIPVRDGALVPDDKFYSDELIDDLKIWTRRKR